MANYHDTSSSSSSSSFPSSSSSFPPNSRFISPSDETDHHQKSNSHPTFVTIPKSESDDFTSLYSSQMRNRGSNRDGLYPLHSNDPPKYPKEINHWKSPLSPTGSLDDLGPYSPNLYGYPSYINQFNSNVTLIPSSSSSNNNNTSTSTTNPTTSTTNPTTNPTLSCSPYVSYSEVATSAAITNLSNLTEAALAKLATANSKLDSNIGLQRGFSMSSIKSLGSSKSGIFFNTSSLPDSFSAVGLSDISISHHFNNLHRDSIGFQNTSSNSNTNTNSNNDSHIFGSNLVNEPEKISLDQADIVEVSSQDGKTDNSSYPNRHIVLNDTDIKREAEKNVVKQMRSEQETTKGFQQIPQSLKNIPLSVGSSSSTLYGDTPSVKRDKLSASELNISALNDTDNEENLSTSSTVTFYLGFRAVYPDLIPSRKSHDHSRSSDPSEKKDLMYRSSNLNGNTRQSSVLSDDGQTQNLAEKIGGVLNVWRGRDGKTLENLQGHAASISSVSRLLTSLLAERDACYIESKRLLESIEESQAEVTRINHLMNELERHREGIEERILKSKERESVVQTALHELDGKIASIKEESAAFEMRIRSIKGEPIALFDEENKGLDVPVDTCVRTLHGHKDSVECLALDGPFGTLVTGSADRTIRVWDLSSLRCIGTLHGHNGWVRSVKMSGKYVLSGSGDHTLKLWDISSIKFGSPSLNEISKNVVKRRYHRGYITNTSTALTMRNRNLKRGVNNNTSDDDNDDNDTNTDDDNDDDDENDENDHEEYEDDISNGRNGERMDLSRKGPAAILTLKGHFGGISSVDIEYPFSVSGSSDKTIRYWDLERGQEINCLRSERWIHEDRLESFSDGISSSSSLDLNVSPNHHPNHHDDDDRESNSASVWSAYGVLPSTTRSTTLSSSNLSNNLDDHYKGDLEGFGMTDIRGWKPNQESKSFKSLSISSQQPQRLMDVGGHVAAVQMREHALAGGYGDGIVRLWDLRSGKCHREFAGHLGAVTCLQFDERCVITGGVDKTVKLWDLRNGNISSDLSLPYSITSLQFDISQIAIAGGTEVQILTRGLGIGAGLGLGEHGARRLLGHPKAVRCVGIGVGTTTRGERLVSGGMEGTVRVYRI